MLFTYRGAVYRTSEASYRLVGSSPSFTYTGQYKTGQGENELYHTTSYGGAVSILETKEVRPKSYEGFVSFSESPLSSIGDIEANDVTIVFKKNAVASQLEKVYYDPEWFQNHRDQAAYIAGEGWLSHWSPPEECYDEEDWEDEACYEEAYEEAEYESFEYKENEKEWISKQGGAPVAFPLDAVLHILVYDASHLEYMQEAVSPFGISVQSPISHRTSATSEHLGWGETTNVMMVQTEY